MAGIQRDYLITLVETYDYEKIMTYDFPILPNIGDYINLNRLNKGLFIVVYRTFSTSLNEFIEVEIGVVREGSYEDYKRQKGIL
jgi:hypothetical protein